MPMKRKISTFLFGLLFLIGFGILIYPMVSNQWNTYRQNQLISSYDNTIQDMEPEDFTSEWEKAKAFNDTIQQNNLYGDVFGEDENDIKDTEYWKILNVADDGVMGYLSIPKINIKLAIYHGTGDKDLQTGVGHGLTHGAHGGVHQMAGKLVELGPGQGHVQMLGAGGVGGDIGQVDVAGGDAGQLDLGLLGGLLQTLHGHLVAAEVDAVGALELADQILHDALVKIIAAQAVVALLAQHGDAVMNRKVLYGSRRRAGTQVEHADARRQLLLDGKFLRLGDFRCVGVA